MPEPPKLATALLRSAAANEPALVGDLLERFQAGQSPWWYWRQVIAVVGRTVSFGVRSSFWWSAAAITIVVNAIEEAAKRRLQSSNPQITADRTAVGLRDPNGILVQIAAK